MKFYIQSKQVSLVQGDCIDFMDQAIGHGMKTASIITDPPYFLSNGGLGCQNGKAVVVDKGDWDKSLGVEENHKFNLKWLSRAQEMLTDNGTICVFGTHHVIHSIGFAMQCLGMKILNDITWIKNNPPPNLSCRRFTHATETIIWAAKNEDSIHTFNYAAMKKENNDKQMKSAWFFNAPGKSEKTHGRHPTQKPLSVIDRLVRGTTNLDDLIFDPFAGSSTTGLAALINGRRFLGCEMNEEYCLLSTKRLTNFLEKNVCLED